MNKEEKNPPLSVDNIYRLNGRVPLQKAIPFGLQHVLAMFAAGIGTCMQPYPIWKIGSRLPIVMGGGAALLFWEACW